MTSRLFKYDFTLSASIVDDPKLIFKLLSEFCKEGEFQKEISADTEYKHYQGRVSLKSKLTLSQLVKATPVSLKGIHWSPTSNSHTEDMDYVSKEYTRCDGPWNLANDEPDYIPRQIREISNLYSWQEQIIEKIKVWDTRSINLLYCQHGNIGKSTLVGYVRAYKLGRALPPVNDYKDMMRMVCDTPTAKAYFIDMPRALKKDKLYGFYTAIESLKDGYAYDDRYTFKEKIFDCPNIWIFSNTLPDRELLSQDRWKIWVVDNSKNLCEWDAQADYVL
jgi:hypothetical protein